ncbi:MAG: hypothetical protein ACJ8ER_17140 [Allosphingosinicella sp.]
MDEGSEGERAPYKRLTAEERARFLAVLRETGNRKAAAAAIGVEPRLMDQRREHDPELDREWEEAVEAANRGLAQAQGPFDCPQDSGLGMIRRGKKGRLQRVATGENRWNGAVERRFMDALRATGSVAAAARAVGFSEGSIWDRRRKQPGFAEAMEKLLEEAELSLELRLACTSRDALADEAGAEGRVAPAVPERFDPEAALRFLKWREEKRRGKRRTPWAKPPSIDEVTAKIIRQVEAIKRQRERGSGGGGGSSPA